MQETLFGAQNQLFFVLIAAWQQNTRLGSFILPCQLLISRGGDFDGLGVSGGARRLADHISRGGDFDWVVPRRLPICDLKPFDTFEMGDFEEPGFFVAERERERERTWMRDSMG
eukprot:TRINITY_DN1946_c0_g6_i1.p2 TRINITY_DN1946_c0_g6~~TRINITY_DN1946_c0_g6_i1.p2  ORF type:complete len:114 (+),score=14.40 TRINITY_DN1946_c0_g6_i1:214-555(+)